MYDFWTHSQGLQISSGMWILLRTEMKDCKNKAQPPLCCNCSRTLKRSTNDLVHSASDVEKCPILSNKVRDRITNIYYEGIMSKISIEYEKLNICKLSVINGTF